MTNTQGNVYFSKRRIILRDYSPGRVLSYMADKLMTTRSGELFIKSKKKATEYKGTLCICNKGIVRANI